MIKVELTDQETMVLLKIIEAYRGGIEQKGGEWTDTINFISTIYNKILTAAQITEACRRALGKKTEQGDLS